MSSQAADDFRESQEKASNFIKGYCPMGCGETLFIGEGGYVTCSWVECPRPDAVSSLLEDKESEHIVVMEEDHFVMQHPLRERLEGALFDCGLHVKLGELPERPVSPGVYRVTERPDPEDPFLFEQLDDV